MPASLAFTKAGHALACSCRLIMATVLEIACRASADQAGTARGWYENEPALAWPSLPGLTAFDLYVPAAGRPKDPMIEAEAGPLLLMMLEFSSVAALEQAARSQRFAAPFSTLPTGLALSANAMERRFYPVSGKTAAAPLS